MTYDLASAINYLHTKNIIHRDIKTLNILITKDNRIKLADLGASKIVSAPMQVTRIGTPLYLAPELVKHKPYDYKVDVWALGCVVYNLAKLQPPFSAENLITLGIQIVSKDPDSIPSIYSNALSDFIAKLLSKLPIDRPNIANVLELIPKKKKKLSIIQESPLEVEENRNSPMIKDENSRFYCKEPPVALIPVIEQIEPSFPAFSSLAREDTIKKFLDRPSTATKARVIFRLEQRTRPLSATNKKNPLYNPRDSHSLRIPNCVRLQFYPQKNVLPTPKRHITINDLYFN